MICHYVSVIAIVFISLHTAKSDFFTSVADLQKLVITVEKVADTLEKYVKNEEERLEELKRNLQRYAKLHEAAKEDSESFLSNPVNAFLLVKYMTADWDKSVNLIEASENNEKMIKISSEVVPFPDKSDLMGAATALMRLQDTYQLDTATVARGNFGGDNSSFELTASDCYELGKQALEGRFALHSLEWLQESLKRLEKENISTVNKLDVLEHIALAAYDVGNFTYGLAVTEEISRLYPDYPQLLNNLLFGQKQKAEGEKEEVSPPNMEPDEILNIKVNGKEWFEEDIVKSYDRLCRGETIKSAAQKSELFCHYTTNNSTYLLLQPVKPEVLSLDPRIVLYHGVIKDNESKIVKEIALPKLERAVVQDTVTGVVEESTDRISKSTQLEDEEHEVLSVLNRRIEDITGLGIQSAEPAQVINYGIGGYYDPHFDFSQDPESIDIFENQGNRIATWIFYLSNVTAGGSTVFPIAGVEVKPVKGAAVFWYNLFENGEGDKSTLHAACPVLTGSKWISTKWLHEVGQEFKRPCRLKTSK